MILAGWDHGTIGSLGMVIGSLITTILTGRQKKTQLIYEEAAALRREMRTDILKLQQQVEELTSDLDEWKEKYYALADENIVLMGRCQKLESEVMEMRKRFGLHSSLAYQPPQPGSST